MKVKLARFLPARTDTIRKIRLRKRISTRKLPSGNLDFGMRIELVEGLTTRFSDRSVEMGFESTLQFPDQQHLYLFKPLPCPVVSYYIISAAGDSCAKLDGVRGFEPVL